MKVLRAVDRELSAKDIASKIKGASTSKVEKIANSLVDHGLIRRGENGYLG
jgi:predicted transcriptional regulator